MNISEYLWQLLLSCDTFEVGIIWDGLIMTTSAAAYVILLNTHSSKVLLKKIQIQVHARTLDSILYTILTICHFLMKENTLTNSM